MTKPTVLALVDVLWAAHVELSSWRKVQKAYFPDVHFTTLNRIALSAGEWLPKDKQVLIALGLKKERKPRTEVQEAIDAMSQMARQGLRLWKRR